MKIVLLSTGHPVWDTYPDGGGIQHQILGLATEMGRRGHEVHVICRSVKECMPTNSRVVFHPIAVRLNDKILSMLTFSKKAADAIDSLEPDIVSAFERFSAYFPSRLHYPTTFTTENYDAFRHYREFAVGYNPLNLILHPLKCRLEEGVMQRSSLVIALTDSIMKYLQSVRICHTVVIPNGVSVEDYSNLGDDKYILYAGRLDAPKCVDVLIRAFARLRDFQSEYVLKIVGRGPRQAELMKLARDCGMRSRIEFIDWVSHKDMPALLGNCSVFVLPSSFEGLPVVLLEAMACSKPVIASNIPGPRDILNHGRNGMLFEVGLVDELVRNLECCLRDGALRQTLATNAKRTVREDFDFHAVSTRMLEAYVNIA